MSLNQSSETSGSTLAEKAYNIVIFGTSGAGKSSVVNLLHDKDVAKVGNNAASVTFESAGYDLTIDATPFRIFDTAGLGDIQIGNVPDDEAIIQLYRLLTSLRDGISLLIYCIAAGRDLPRKDTIRRNWQCFHEVICKKEVPILLLITRAEETQTRDGSLPTTDQWWLTSGNANSFREYRLYPNAVACITASKGLKRKNGYTLQDEYTASRKRVESLILRHYAEPWHLPKIIWFATIIKGAARLGVLRLWHKEVRVKTRETLDLVEKCGMDPEDAEELARRLQDADEDSFDPKSLENASNTTLAPKPPRPSVRAGSVRGENGKVQKMTAETEHRGLWAGFSRIIKGKPKENKHT